MENLLRVKNTYEELRCKPKQQYEKKLRALVKKGREIGILNNKKKNAKYLISESTKTTVIYYLPKIHRRIGKPPGRPIISGINSLFPG